ncbi:MAG: Gfo/Idh/MocA family oxidoreductase [Candidatus Hodarchaeales archaeon]
MQQSKQITAVIIGAGNRGKDVYGHYALTHPDELKIVAVAEPNEIRRKKISDEHEISHDMTFQTWRTLLEKERLADAAIICTQDQMHVEPTLAALELGYDILLEKPMATTPEECIALVQKSQEVNRQLRIAHVLRYNRFFSTVHELVKSGRLGKIITIDHRENVSYYHMAHSFVRGNWSNEKTSSPMILAKSCHDLDILFWLEGTQGARVEKISSFGNLMHFKPDNAPEGAPDRCTDGCPAADTCKYYAPGIYIEIIPLLRILQRGGKGFPKMTADLALDHPRMFKTLKNIIPFLRKVEEYDGWPVSTITEDFSVEGKWKALETGPYGRCVYHCNNDVVDHQVTIIEFDNGTTATFTMHGFSHYEGRTIRIDGTKGTLIGEAYSHGDNLIFYDHLRGSKEVLLHTGMNIEPESGHGGGDTALIRSFIKSLQSNKKDHEPLTSAKSSLESHLMAFAAEESRKNKVVINFKNFKAKYIESGD